jgi:glutamate-1-semialdehyde 2,1-aminomutase
MMTLFFTAAPVHDYATATASNTARYGAYFRGMLARGVYLAPSQYEAAFVSTAHQAADLDFTIAAAQDVLTELAKRGD